MNIALTISICFNFFFHIKFGLADNVNILQELQLVKDQVKQIVDLKQELYDIKRTNYDLKEKLEVVFAEYIDLKETIKVISRENADLKRKTLNIERSVNVKSWPNFQNNKIKESSLKFNDSKPSVKSISQNDMSHMQLEGAERSNLLTGENIRNLLKQQQYFNQNEKRQLITTPVPQQGPLIAFFARVKSIVSNVGTDQVIPFEAEDLDIGDSFNAQTSVFTCPHTGVYAFFVTILSYPNIHVNSAIVKDGNNLAASYSLGPNNGFGSGSTSVVVRLQKGEKVWVRVDGSGHHGSGNMIGENYSSFMGFSLMLE